MGILYAAGGSRPVRPIMASAPTSDPNSLVASTTSRSAGRLTFVTQNPGTLSILPSACARWYQTSLQGMDGRQVASVRLGELLRALVRANSATPVADHIYWVGFETAAGNGAAWGLMYSATGWTVVRSHNVGAGWVAVVPATATSANTLFAQGDLGFGTINTQGLYRAWPLDASLAPLTTANVSTTSGTAALLGTPIDRFFFGFGWATGIGGSAGSVSVGFHYSAHRLSEAPNFDPFA